MKKVLSVICVMALAGSMLAGCGGSAATATTKAAAAATTAAAAATTKAAAATTAAAAAATTKAAAAATTAAATANKIDPAKLKVGIIYVGDENEGYTASHMNGVKEACKELGIPDGNLIQKTNIKEDESCTDAAEDLASQGCNIIFATSFGHESYLLQSAEKHKDIQFCHATGYQAAGAKLDNFHNYFDNIYEARYVSGVVAGMKLKEMIDKGTITEDKAKMGYVGAFPYAEVISGFTSFYLGAKSVVPKVTMEVKYTNSWADPAKEGETANQLISDGCVLISQHADTTGAPSVCQQKKTPCVGYNVDMTSVAPDYALTSPTNNWGVYYKYAIESVMKGTKIDTDWSKGFAQDAVRLTKLGSSVAQGTDAKVKEIEDSIKGGKLHVFDTSTFTVGGKKLDSWKDKNGTEFIKDGYFHESEYASAPAFYMIIDGIEAPALQ